MSISLLEMMSLSPPNLRDQNPPSPLPDAERWHLPCCSVGQYEQELTCNTPQQRRAEPSQHLQPQVTAQVQHLEVTENVQHLEVADNKEAQQAQLASACAETELPQKILRQTSAKAMGSC